LRRQRRSCSIASHSAPQTASPHCLPALPEAARGAEGAGAPAAQDVTLFIDDIGTPAAHGTKASYAPIGSSAAAGALVPMTQAPVSNSAPAFNGGNNGLIYSGSSFYGCGRRPSRRVHASACANACCAPLTPWEVHTCVYKNRIHLHKDCF
jgi:hypothetical protein